MKKQNERKIKQNFISLQKEKNTIGNWDTTIISAV